MLNDIESKVLVAIADSVMAATGGEFGFTDEADYESIGITAKQFSGYVSQLVQKGMIYVYDKTQCEISNLGIANLHLVGYEFADNIQTCF